MLLAFLSVKNCEAIEPSGSMAFSLAEISINQKPPKIWGFKKWKLQLAADTTQRKKGVAIGLAVALGPLGVHRIYLGTRPAVPVVYALTLGGGFGILTLTDVAAILGSVDLARFEDNDQVIMWMQ